MRVELFGINFTQPDAKGLTMQMSPGHPPVPTSEVPRTPARDEYALPASDNMLAGNFVQHGFQERSRYVNGLMAGLEVQNSFMSQMQSVVAGYAHIRDLSPDMNNAEKNLLGQKAAEALKQVIDDEVKKEIGEEIEAMADEIEEKADEAVAPESEEVMESQTSPQEELEKSMEETEPAAQSAEATEPEKSDEPEPADEQSSSEEGPPAPTLDIIV